MKRFNFNSKLKCRNRDALHLTFLVQVVGPCKKEENNSKLENHNTKAKRLQHDFNFNLKREMKYSSFAISNEEFHFVISIQC